MKPIAFLILIAATASAPLRATAAGCYEDWSEAAPIVRKEGLASVTSLWQAAQARISGDIVKTTLCEENGSFIYRLVVRAPDGKLSNEKVDARNLFNR